VSKLFLSAFFVVHATVAASAEPAPSKHARIGELVEIDFARSSAQLPIDVAPKLSEVLTWDRDNPIGLIVLDGHGDRGDPNLPLSQRRAEAVRAQLVANGVDADRIVIAAYGEDRGGKHGVVVWTTHDNLQAVIDHTLANGVAMIESTVLGREVATR
jgi:hypothetical protein